LFHYTGAFTVFIEMLAINILTQGAWEYHMIYWCMTFTIIIGCSAMRTDWLYCFCDETTDHFMN